MRYTCVIEKDSQDTWVTGCDWSPELVFQQWLRWQKLPAVGQPTSYSLWKTSFGRYDSQRGERINLIWMRPKPWCKRCQWQALADHAIRRKAECKMVRQQIVCPLTWRERRSPAMQYWWTKMSCCVKCVNCAAVQVAGWRRSTRSTCVGGVFPLASTAVWFGSLGSQTTSISIETSFFLNTWWPQFSDLSSVLVENQTKR